MVTKPFLPPEEDYHKYLRDIWQRCWLTNDGPLVRELEERLKAKFDSRHVIFVTNGTVAIQLAMKALGLDGEVITTPFSYVATTSSIVWENCRPVFVDIDPEKLTIDASKIEEKITAKTSGILATHVFGNPCDMDAIQEIADRHDLKVIYDAAHCYGSTYKGRSVMSFGDMSCISFHATKLFHTIEGGAITTDDDELAYRLTKVRNFGHNGPMKFDGVGINGKNSEFHAAMGLVNLKYMDDIMSKRRHQLELYKTLLKDCPVQFPVLENGAEDNAAYCAILFQSEEELLAVEKALSDQQIGSRRYFNPSLNKLDYIDYQPCPVSEDVSDRVLCLPVYHELHDEDIIAICHLLRGAFRENNVSI